MKGEIRQRIEALSEEQRRLLARKLSQRSAPTARASIERRPRPSGQALTSYAQQRMLFLDQLVADPCIYNNQVAWRLLGELNERALRSTLDLLVARHETLRTTFSKDDIG